MARRPISDQIREAMWRPTPDDRRALDLAAIESALAEADRGVSRVPPTRRKLAMVTLAAALVVIPAGMAVAAENSIPGDLLFPIKRVTETVRSWVDDDVIAVHRLEELERMIISEIDSDRINDQVERATEAFDRIETDPALEQRLVDAANSVTDGRPVDASEGLGSGATDRPPSTTLPGDTPSTTRPSDRPPDSATTTSLVDSTTTTVANTTTTTVVATFRVGGRVMAGPTCPVVRVPPDPDCADQPVAGAVLVITSPDGKELGRIESDLEGRFHTRLPTGSYLLVPRPYDGLLGTAPEQEFVVEGAPVELDVAYDTGIR